MNKYSDIINLSKPKSNRPSMSIEARAAQFAPFSALTGYEEAIKEVGRVTNQKLELSDARIDIINERLNDLKNNLNRQVKITYFVKDKLKDGGEYITEEVYIKKIDSYKLKLILFDKEISFDNILEIDYV